MTDKIAGT